MKAKATVIGVRQGASAYMRVVTLQVRLSFASSVIELSMTEPESRPYAIDRTVEIHLTPERGRR